MRSLIITIAFIIMVNCLAIDKLNARVQVQDISLIPWRGFKSQTLENCEVALSGWLVATFCSSDPGEIHVLDLNSLTSQGYHLQQGLFIDYLIKTPSTFIKNRKQPI